MNLGHKGKVILVNLLIITIFVCMLSGCDIGSKHLEMKYDKNDNEDISTWDDSSDNNTEDNTSDWDTAVVSTWDDVDDYSDWVYSEILFDEITDEMPIVECKVLDYQSNGKYFDGEKIFELVGDKFDVNSFLAKYAVGTGVIVICVILSYTPVGPIACFFAGAAEGSVSMAVKGAAFGAATKAVMSAIKSGGDFENAIYDSLEGSADGYMWGAIYGAITGGFNSKYCFTENTVVKCQDGYKPISEICKGDWVWAYDENCKKYELRQVTQIMSNTTYDTVKVTIASDEIECTENHPFYTDNGWKAASELCTGTNVMTFNNEYKSVLMVENKHYSEPVRTYNLCVEDYHSYMVGESEVVVHNRCNPNEKYADQTRYFDEGSELAKNYPDGVYIKPNGYPDFSKYSKKTVKFDPPTKAGVEANECLRGDCYWDFKLANKQAFGIDSVSATPKGYTWHHVEDGRTMELIPTDLHRGIGHDGGEKVIQQLLSAITGG